MLDFALLSAKDASALCGGECHVPLFSILSREGKCRSGGIDASSAVTCIQITKLEDKELLSRNLASVLLYFVAKIVVSILIGQMELAGTRRGVDFMGGHSKAGASDQDRVGLRQVSSGEGMRLPS